MDICFFTKHQISWGSSRNRIAVYLDCIKKGGHSYKIISIIPNKLSQIWIGDKRKAALLNTIYSFWYARLLKHLKLIWLIIIAKRFELILIQKVNLWYALVWVLRLRNKNIIFDFDDQCFWDLDSLQKSKISLRKKIIFWRRGIQHPRVLRLYNRIIVGNRYLANIASLITEKDRITTIPTPINCLLYRPKDSSLSNSPIVIGWSGTGENHLRHLELLVKPLKSLEKNNAFIFKLVGAMYSSRIKALFGFLTSKFICFEWVEPQQLPEIMRAFDIGVMPLRDDSEARAKCGFKALEYMASGVATIVSPVGINKEIVKDGINGFLAKGEKDWFEKLSILISDENLRNRFAKEGRKTVEESYSLSKTSQSFMDTIEKKFNG